MQFRPHSAAARMQAYDLRMLLIDQPVLGRVVLDVLMIGQEDPAGRIFVERTPPISPVAGEGAESVASMKSRLVPDCNADAFAATGRCSPLLRRFVVSGPGALPATADNGQALETLRTPLQ